MPLITRGDPKDLAVLYGKMSQVTAAAEWVPKNGKHPMGFKFVRDADLIDSLRQKITEHGLTLVVGTAESVERIPLPPPASGRYMGDVTRLVVEFTLCCAETGASITTTMVAEGQDAADKAVAKALTGAIKNYLTKTFLVPTGDDPESSGEGYEDHEQRQGQPGQQRSQGQQRPAVQRTTDSRGNQFETRQAPQRPNQGQSTGAPRPEAPQRPVQTTTPEVEPAHGGAPTIQVGPAVAEHIEFRDPDEANPHVRAKFGLDGRIVYAEGEVVAKTRALLDGKESILITGEDRGRFVQAIAIRKAA